MTPSIPTKPLSQFVRGLAFCSAALLPITAFAVPIANSDTYTVTSGQSITVMPLENDQGQALFIEAVDMPSPYGSGVTRFTRDTVVYTAPEGFVGSTVFWYGVKDERGEITSAPITITVNAPVAFPEAVADSATTSAGQPITVDVLANDTGSGLFIEAVDQPAPYGTGSAAIVDNKIRYVPPAGFVGSSRFYYGIKDSVGNITSAELSITVSPATPTSPWPTAGNDRIDTVIGEALLIEPLWNDVGDVLSVTDVDRNTTQGSQVVIEGNTLRYTPAAWAKGEDQFWYQVTDSHGRTNAAKVTVVVEHDAEVGPWPTAGADTYQVNQNSDGAVLAVFENDTGSGLSIHELHPYTKKGGKVSFSEAVIRYTPPRDFIGVDEFWYAMKDVYGRTNAAKVTLNVVEVVSGPNREPDAVEDGLSALINQPEMTLDILANDTDPDGDALSVIEVQAAVYGTVRLTDIGQVRYTPPTSAASDSFGYTISDGRGGTAFAVATISVTDPNDDNDHWPVINGELLTVTPGETVIIKVLENDSDADGDTLILDQVSNAGQGTIRKIEDTNGNLTWVEYSALPSASGSDEFYYGVHDGRGKNGSGKVTIRFR